MANEKPKFNLGTTLSIIFLSLISLVVIIAVFWQVISRPGVGPGADTTSFAHTTAEIVDFFKKYHHFPPVDLSWYAGFELQAAPPLIYLFLGAIYYLTNNIELSTRILHPLGIVIFFLVMFYVMRKEKYPVLNSWVSAMGYAFMPAIFLTWGSYTKFVAFFFLPLAFFFTNKILTEPKNKYKYIAGLAIATALVIYSHPMSGVVFVLSLSIYAILYAIFEKKIDSRRFILVLLSFGLGFLLASSYVIPFVLEKANRTAIAPEEMDVHVPVGDTLNSILWSTGHILFLLIVPLYVVFKFRRAKFTALFLTGFLVAIFCLLYNLIPLGGIFPFNLTYNYIWLHFTAFALAYLMGMTIGLSQPRTFGKAVLKVLGAFLFLGIFFLVINKPYVNFGKIVNYDSREFPGDLAITQVIKELPNQGRIFVSHYPFGLTNWILWLKGDKPNIEGHYYGISRIARQIAYIADAIHNQYPNYVAKKLKFLNVRYFIANQVLWDLQDPNEVNIGQKTIRKLEEEGYRLLFDTYANQIGSPSAPAKYRLYYLDQKPEYVQPVEEKILTIGKYGSTLAAAASEARISMLEGGSVYLDDYDLEFLQQFPTIFLYGFGYRDKYQAEALAKEYVKRGGKLIIELFGMENSQLEENPDFLGVIGFPRKISGPIKIEKAEEVKDLLPDTFQLPGEIIDPGTGVLDYRQLKEWNALEYHDLDASWAKLPPAIDGQEEIYSILGIKNIEDRRVIFVGMNLFYHLYNTHNPEELNLISQLATNFNGLKTKETINSDFEAQQEFLNEEYWRFKIKTNQDRLALISLAYSPHWKAYLDSGPIKTYHAEDLIVLKIPEGQHTLEIKYERTMIKNISIGLSIFTVCILIWILIISAFRPRRIIED
mgnify:CR=1 FL=1